MKKTNRVTKVLIYMTAMLCAFLTCGGLINNLNIVIDFEWWQTLLCFVLFLMVINLEKLLPSMFREENDYE